MRIPTLPESCVSNPLQQGELISAIHDSALHKSWLQTSISPSLIHFFKSLSAICWFSSVCQPSADMILLLSNDANEHVEVEARLKDKLRVNCDNLIFFICRVRVLMISDDKCWWWCNIYIYTSPWIMTPSLEATTLPKTPPISHESWMVLDPNEWARHPCLW